MKKYIFSLGMALAISLCTGNSYALNLMGNETSTETLQRTVNTFNTTKAPTMMTNGMKITKMELTESSLVYYICVDGSNVNIKTLKAAKKPLRKTLLQQYSQSNVQDLSSTIPYCRDAGIGVTYYYYDAKGKSLQISFDSKEI